MLNQSVISKSGQLWKLAIAVAAILVGSFAPLSAASGLTWTTGSIVAIVGYLFGLAAIRCANCHSRWFWEAAIDAGLYGPLFKRPSCPKCAHDFELPPKYS